MYRVLMPLDDDEDRTEKQIEAIENLPKGDEAIEVTLLYVFTEKEENAPDKYRGTDHVMTVNLAQERLEESGVETKVWSESGDPAESILGHADEEDFDCILIGSRRMSPTGKVLFGSVAQAVLLDAEVPVMIAR